MIKNPMFVKADQFVVGGHARSKINASRIYIVTDISHDQVQLLRIGDTGFGKAPGTTYPIWHSLRGNVGYHGVFMGIAYRPVRATSLAPDWSNPYLYKELLNFDLEKTQ